MRLFRYFDAQGGLATLRNRKLRWASPLAFNDPFELTPRVECLTDEALEYCFQSKERMDEFHQTNGFAHGYTENDSKSEYIKTELPRLLDLARKNQVKNAQRLRFEMLGLIARRFRILCCSHSYESILMWSHYADKHRGLVIELETDELIAGVNLEPHLLEAQYHGSPASIPAFHPDTASFANSLDLVLATKAIQWSYEEEVRIKLPVKDGVKEEEPVDHDFSPACIKRVIVGCYDHNGVGLYSAINKLADHDDYKHVHFQRACIDPHDYKLRFADRPMRTAS